MAFQFSNTQLAWIVFLWALAFLALHAAFRALSACCFSTYRRLSLADRAYWAGSLVSTTHAIIVVVASVQGLAGEPGMWALRADLYAESEQTLWGGPLFMGYIIADLAVCTVYGIGGMANTIHHTIAIGLFWQILEGGYGHWHVIAAWLLEASTPFVNFRWMLSKAGMDSGPAYMINGSLMALLWLLLRIIFCGWGLVSPASYQLLELSAPRAISMYVGFFGGYLLQWFWGYKILLGLLKVMGIVKGKKKRGGE